MKLSIATAAFVLSTVPVLAPGVGFAQTTGVSNPDQSEIKATPDAPPMERRPLTKPAAGTPVAPAPAVVAAPPTSQSGEVYGAYVPYHAPGAPAAPVTLSKSAFDPDANIVTEVDRTPPAVVNPAVYDEGVVISVPEKDGELREGTLLKGRIKHELSTATTAEGTPFSAELTEDVLKDGKVILPTGALLEGKVTQVHSGRRISGSAMMHLEPRSVTLPDGTQYILHAQLIDTSAHSSTKIGSEGTLVRRDHAKETLAVVGGVTGAGAVAGAMIGGGVGAVVGAGIGAGAGTIVWLKQDRQATLPQDSLLVFSLTTPMILKPMHVANVGGQ
ncbi:hypothetical protein [Granulicella sp. dw_53]|uniref:hypothetical protein n=1 Tax=Granulicella sp. dw_53 TaxID=2719792 RepID=UPI001BD2576A|nr:hypothetical protein [Granulicella sp. dw_53]